MNSRRLSNGNGMDVSDVFMSDPFLSLDDDLDDVSEVIRSNMIGEDTNCVGGMGMVKSMFDESRTPSPQYLHDSEYGDEDVKEKEIDQIVSLLQDDKLNFNGAPGHYRHPQHLLFHHNDGTTDEGRQYRNNNFSHVAQSMQNYRYHHHHQQQQQHQQQYQNHQSTFKTIDDGLLAINNNQQQSTGHHITHQNQIHASGKYFMDTNGADVNMHYAAALSDSDANSPLSSASCGGSGGGGGGAMMNGFPDQLFQQQHQAMMPHNQQVSNAFPADPLLTSVTSPQSSTGEAKPDSHHLGRNASFAELSPQSSHSMAGGSSRGDLLMAAQRLPPTTQSSDNLNCLIPPNHQQSGFDDGYLMAGLESGQLSVDGKCHAMLEEFVHFREGAEISSPSSTSDVGGSFSMFSAHNGDGDGCYENNLSKLSVHYHPQAFHHYHSQNQFVKQKTVLPPSASASMLYSAYSNSEVNGFNSDDGVPLDGGSPSAAFVNAGKKSSQKSNTKAELIRMLLEMSPSELENLRPIRKSSGAGRVRNQKVASSSLSPTDNPAASASTSSLNVLPLSASSGVTKRQSTARRKTSKALFVAMEQCSAAANTETLNTAQIRTPLVHSSTNTAQNNALVRKTSSQVSPSLSSDGSVLSPTQTFFSSSNSLMSGWKEEEEEDESDDETDTEPPMTMTVSGDSAPGTTKRGAKPERRTAHNLIEKKYRCSINDRINHLKEMLASDETKLSKSATLRKAIEHINALRTQNAELLRDNNCLRATMEAAGLRAPTPPPHHVVPPPLFPPQQMSPFDANASPSNGHYHSHRRQKAEAFKQQKAVSVDSDELLRHHHSGSSSFTATDSLMLPSHSPPSDTVPLNGCDAVVVSSSRSVPFTHSNSSSSPSTADPANQKNSLTKKALSQQSRVTLCVFMFMVIAFNPLAVFFSAAASGEDGVPSGADSSHQQPFVFAHHRTLLAEADDFRDGASPFDADSIGGAAAGGSEKLFWLRETFIRSAFVWLINSLVVIFVLMRLLVYGEPVADTRGPSWNAFIATKRSASHAIGLRNYREAQRQLCDSLQILGRPIPKSGGLEEFMSLTWQIIRHLLNGLWIGRWLARRRRSSTQPVPVVCRSHAATSLVYHQLHQLHLMGVNGIELSELGALNLALAAVNLAESAGVARDGVTHRLRADIYVCAALRVRFALPPMVRGLCAAYFMRRARRHVRKAQLVDGADVRAIQWIFHPLAGRFLKANANTLLADILRNPKQPALNFPFSDACVSPKPIDCLTSAFKMHLLSTLMKQLCGILAADVGTTVTDFVEISHLLLDICTAPALSVDLSGWENVPKTKRADFCMLDWASLSANSDSNEAGKVNGDDELCTWWTHLVTCGLYWRYGDNTHAQKHYALVRKCPTKLLNNDLALAIGLAFCTRKMCFDDRTKRNFTEMVWMHAQKSFAHLERDNFPITLVRNKSSNVVLMVQKLAKSVTYEWIMTSLLDIWNHRLSEQRPCWEQCAPSPVRRLYNTALGRFTAIGGDFVEPKKVLFFKVLNRALTGANPTVTWRMLRALFSASVTASSLATDGSGEYKRASATRNRNSSGSISCGGGYYYYDLVVAGFACEGDGGSGDLQLAVLQRLRRDFCNYCNLVLY